MMKDWKVGDECWWLDSIPISIKKGMVCGERKTYLLIKLDGEDFEFECDKDILFRTKEECKAYLIEYVNRL